VEYYRSIYNYHKLGVLLQKYSTYYTDIVSKKNRIQSYFFIGQYGKGFNESERGEFIIKGLKAQRFTEVFQNIQSKYPKSESLKTMPKNTTELNELNEKNGKLKNKTGQYIFVCVVKASSDDEKNMINYKRNKEISLKIQSYSDYNNKDLFSTENRYNTELLKTGIKQKNEFKEMVREITYYKVEFSYPYIFRKQRIKEKEIVILTPLQSAIRDMEDKNREITDMIINHQKDIRPDTNKLSMLMSGMNHKI
jgi:hypothetical protein